MCQLSLIAYKAISSLRKLPTYIWCIAGSFIWCVVHPTQQLNDVYSFVSLAMPPTVPFSTFEQQR